MKTFELEKESAKIKFKLEKLNLPDIKAEVVVLTDVSGSTQELFSSGSMQEAIQRVLPIAIQFDDNGEVPVYAFNQGANYTRLQEDLTAKNFTSYVKKQIISGHIPKWGGTDYSAVLAASLMDLGFQRVRPTTQAVKGFSFKRFFGMEKEQPVSKDPYWTRTSGTNLPALVYMFTDGQPGDKDETRKVLRECVDSCMPVYFNFIGVGMDNFEFLQDIADEFPNVGFAAIQDIARVAGGDDIYDYLLPKEMLEWLKVVGVK